MSKQELIKDNSEFDAASELAGLQKKLTLAFDYARKEGATSMEASAGKSVGLQVQVRLGEVETIQFSREHQLTITVYYGQQQGGASTSDLRDAALQQTVKAACAIAKQTTADPYAGLAEADLLAKAWPDLDLDHPIVLEANDFIASARQCEQSGLTYDKRIQKSEGASVSSQRGVRCYANSHGFMGGYASSYHSIHCALIAEDAHGMQREGWYSVGRAWPSLESPDAIGKQAAKRTLARLDARRLPTQTAQVLFIPELASGLIAHLISAISGSNLYRKASFLQDSIGKSVCSSIVSLREEPHLPQGLASHPFDSDGVATKPSMLVTDGVLQRYVLSTYSARRLGLTTTGNAGGVHNVCMQPGMHDFNSLVKTMHRGFIVTELLGQGVNIVTGDYSRGAVGFWVEHGEIQHAVHEVTIAGNLREMLKNIVAVGCDIDHRSSILTGSLVVDGMTIAGTN